MTSLERVQALVKFLEEYHVRIDRGDLRKVEVGDKVVLTTEGGVTDGPWRLISINKKAKLPCAIEYLVGDKAKSSRVRRYGRYSFGELKRVEIEDLIPYEDAGKKLLAKL